MPQRIGILGGTFDPPHYAHLILAQHAYEELRLDKVLFVPSGVPPHKDQTRSSVDDRVAMTQQAIQNDARFQISRVEIDRPGPHYTIDTIRIIQDQNPDDELFFIMGGDVYRDIVNWSRPQELFETCKLAVAVMRRPSRDGSELSLDMHHDKIPDLEKNAILLQSPLVEISSTDIVERISQGRSVRYMTPESVLQYIEQHNLYRDNK